MLAVADENRNYNVVVFVEGKQMDFPDQKPFIDAAAGRTYVPIRFVSEALGATVNWDSVTQTVYIKDTQHDIRLTIGSDNYFVNSAPKTLDAPPVITGGRTMVPLRFVGEGLGRKVDYTPWGAFGRVDIYAEDKPVIPEPKPNAVQLMDQALGGDYMHPYDPKGDIIGWSDEWVCRIGGCVYAYSPPRPDHYGVMGTGTISIKCEAKKVSDNDKMRLKKIAETFLSDSVDEVMDAIDAGINAFKTHTDPYEHWVQSKMVENCMIRARGDTTGDFVNVYIRLFK